VLKQKKLSTYFTKKQID